MSRKLPTLNAQRSTSKRRPLIVEVVPSAVGLKRMKSRRYFPRVLWADCDPDDKKTPVAIYTSRAEQRGNRPDLKPVRVVVISLEDHLQDSIDFLQKLAEAGR